MKKNAKIQIFVCIGNTEKKIVVPFPTTLLFYPKCYLSSICILVVFTTINIIVCRENKIENIKIIIFLVFLQEFSELLQPLSVRLSSFLL